MLEATTITATFGKAKFANLKIKPKSKNVKRGKKVTFKVKVKNTGDASAKKLKVCGKGPKKLVKKPGCKKAGNLAAGKSKTVKIKVKVKKSARKGKKAKVKFTAYVEVLNVAGSRESQSPGIAASAREFLARVFAQ